MDTMRAFAKGLLNRDKELMVFDWDKAAALIRDAKATEASAGLSGDWEWTGGRIFANGLPVPAEETYTYLASTWAMPELEIDGVIHECYRMQSEAPGWDSGTYWPESARAALSAAKE